MHNVEAAGRGDALSLEKKVGSRRQENVAGSENYKCQHETRIRSEPLIPVEAP